MKASAIICLLVDIIWFACCGVNVAAIMCPRVFLRGFEVITHG